MHTVITDKTDLKSIEKILAEFESADKTDVFSTEMSPLERALVMNELRISNVAVQQENNLILFVLNNGTVLQKPIDQIVGLAKANKKDILAFENMGDGILWPKIPKADMSLKTLIQEELVQKYNIEIA